MRRAPDDLDRLMAGEPPAGLDAVSVVLRVAGAPPTDAEVDGAASVASAMAAAASSHPHRIKVPRASWRLRVAVVALAAAMMLTGSLAAAGALTDGAQGVAATVLSKIGIHVPNPNAGAHPYGRGKSGNTKPKKFGPAPSDSPEPSREPNNGRDRPAKPAR